MTTNDGPDRQVHPDRSIEDAEVNADERRAAPSERADAEDPTMGGTSDADSAG